MSSNQLILLLAALVVVLVAVLFGGKVKSKIGHFFSIDTDNRSVKNRIKIKGDDNDTEQGLGKTVGAVNSVKRYIKVDGKRNRTRQG